MRADHGPDILELFHERNYFPKFGSGRNSFLRMVKGFEGSLAYIQHDYDSFTFIPSRDYLNVEGHFTRQNLRKVLGRWQTLHEGPLIRYEHPL